MLYFIKFIYIHIKYIHKVKQLYNYKNDLPYTYFKY